MSSTRSRASEHSPTDTIRLVTRILERYATNGVFRGFSAISQTSATAKYRVVWHYERALHLFVSVPKRTLQLGILLPDVPSRSPMYRDLRKFVELLHSADRPAHRRVDPARAHLVCSNRGGNVGVTMSVVENDFDYATRKLIHAANEILLVFLQDGPYSQYLQETLGAYPA
jgi:hypothetical protein